MKMHVLMHLGVIFTSPRGVKAVSHIQNVNDLMTEWQSLAVFAVGEETSRIIKLELGLDAQGHDAGSATSLADIILKSKLKFKKKKKKNLICGLQLPR